MGGDDLLAYSSLVEEEARRAWRPWHRVGCDREDLVGWGWVGLCEAALLHDGRGDFVHHARLRIRGRIRTAVERTGYFHMTTNVRATLRALGLLPRWRRAGGLPLELVPGPDPGSCASGYPWWRDHLKPKAAECLELLLGLDGGRCRSTRQVAVLVGRHRTSVGPLCRRALARLRTVLEDH